MLSVHRRTLYLYLHSYIAAAVVNVIMVVICIPSRWEGMGIVNEENPTEN